MVLTWTFLSSKAPTQSLKFIWLIVTVPAPTFWMLIVAVCRVNDAAWVWIALPALLILKQENFLL